MMDVSEIDPLFARLREAADADAVVAIERLVKSGADRGLARINALAYRPAALLEAELRGDPEAALAAQLVQGVVNAGVRLLHAAPLDEVEALTVELAQTLVRSRRA